MPDVLASNLNVPFKIVSRMDPDLNRPTSVDFTKQASQAVCLDFPVQLWDIKLVGDHTYLLKLGEYSVTGIEKGIAGDTVTASVFHEQNVKWHATYREDQDGYTIEPVDDQNKGWTVAPIKSPNPPIIIQPLRVTTSIPPQYDPWQLFWFMPADE